MKIGKDQIRQMLDGVVFINKAGDKTFYMYPDFLIEGNGIRRYIINSWNQSNDDWEPILPKTKRRANRNEWLSWACSADALGWVVRYDGIGMYPPQYTKYACTIEDYQRAKMTPTGPYEWEYFEVEE